MKQWIKNSLYIIAGLFVGLTLVPALANSVLNTTSTQTSLISEAEAIDSAMNHTDEMFELVSVRLDADDNEFDIILVNEFKSVDVEVNATSGKVTDWDVTWIRNGSLISVEEAKFIALQRAGEGYTVSYVDLDDDDDTWEYDLLLVSEGFKIDVEIDAQSGTITKWVAQGLVSQVNEVEGLLSVEEVKAIVLAKAGSSYVVVSVVLDDDDDDLDYDVVLSSLDTYIEAEVDALTGEIEDWDVKRFVSNDSAQSSFNESSSNVSYNDSSSQDSFNDSSSLSSDRSSNDNLNVLISRDQAIAIARERIGESPMLIKLELDYNDGRPYYDLEFKTDDVEYEFEIDGLNGAILEFEIDDE